MKPKDIIVSIAECPQGWRYRASRRNAYGQREHAQIVRVKPAEAVLEGLKQEQKFLDARRVQAHDMGLFMEDTATFLSQREYPHVVHDWLDLQRERFVVQGEKDERLAHRLSILLERAEKRGPKALMTSPYVRVV